MTFLLFAPASTKWLDDVYKDRKSGRDRSHNFDTLLRYVLSVTFCGADACFESYGPKETR